MKVGGVLLVLLFSSACDALQLFVNSPQTATLGADTLLQCHFVVEYPPVDKSYLTITWSFEGKILLKVGDTVQAFEPQARIDELDILNGNASLMLSNLTITDGGTYSCSVLYSPFSKEKYITLKIQAKPKVIIPEDVVFKGKETLIKCYVFGFYPMEIDVSWLKNGQILPGSSTSKPLRDEDGTFNVTSTVPLLAQDSDASLNLSCLVQHASLPGPLQKDVELLLTAKPKVIIPEQVAFRGKETLIRCYVFGFYPMEIDISWLKNGQILPGSSTSEPLRDEDGTFNVTSTVPLLAQDSDASLNLSCLVKHASLPGPLQKDVELLLTEEKVSVAALVVSMLVILVFTAVGLLLFRKYGKEQEKLTMSEIRGPRVWTLGEPVQLVCVGFHCPKGIEIKWTKLHKGLETMITPNPMTDCQDTEPLLGKEGHKAATFKVRESRGYVTINSAVIVTPTMGEDEGAVFKCTFFTKDSKKINEEKEFKDFKIQGKPQATDIKCVPHDGTNVQCCLELLRFYPKGIQLKWSSGTGSLKDVPFEEHEMGEAPPVSIRSTCVINEDAFTDPNFKIRVTWEHSSLDDPEYKEISVTDPAFPGRPDLQDILVPKLIHGKEVSLQGQVSGYFPKELKVEWLRMERGSDARLTTQGDGEGTVWKQDITDCRREPEIGYSCTARLTFNPDLHRDRGSEVICRVSHPSLQRALEKTTGMLTVLGVPTVNPWQIITMTSTSDAKTLSLEVDHFSPGGKEIWWFCDPTGVLPSKLHMTPNQDGTHTAKSTCEPDKSMRKKMKEHGKITVIIEHEALDEALIVSARYKGKGKGWELLKEADKALDEALEVSTLYKGRAKVGDCKTRLISKKGRRNEV